jgi:hypothetical protein
MLYYNTNKSMVGHLQPELPKYQKEYVTVALTKQS